MDSYLIKGQSNGTPVDLPERSPLRYRKDLIIHPQLRHPTIIMVSCFLFLRYTGSDKDTYIKGHLFRWLFYSISLYKESFVSFYYNFMSLFFRKRVGLTDIFIAIYYVLQITSLSYMVILNFHDTF